jgi:molybdopterin molybdotransferase
LAADVRAASIESPVHLALVGGIAAGSDWHGSVHPGEAVRILSGARLPQGADSVVSEEFTEEYPEADSVKIYAEPGRNILRQETDVKTGEMIVRDGQRLYPTMVGLLATAGFQEVPVIRQPRVAILATGDEALAPGSPLVQGKLYASNLYTLASWCLQFGFEVETFVVQDEQESVCQALRICLDQFYIVLTSGGAWKGERRSGACPGCSRLG